ncbi:hypothetical protein VTO73DRAFT_13915 [Trametes versicolor]
MAIKDFTEKLKRKVSNLSNRSGQGKRVRTKSPSENDTDTDTRPPTPASRTPSVEEVPDEDEVEIIEKTQDDEDKELISRMRDSWSAPVYAFFSPDVYVERAKGRTAIVFKCAAPKCKKLVRRYLDTKDATSTSNLRSHVKVCSRWGEGVLTEASKYKSADDARAVTEAYQRTGTITTIFKRLRKGKLTFSTRQHTTQETRAEIVRWVCESKRPFAIVRDRGFLMLMKTGRPEHAIPSPSTVARDVKRVFARVRCWLAKMLQEYDGDLSFTVDAWTSPNHKALVAFGVHLQQNGTPLSFLLDVVEVAQSHTGKALAEAFVDVLKTFGIEEKLLAITADNAAPNDTMMEVMGGMLPDFPGGPNRGRCFDHVVNLCAKSVLRPFDVTPKKVEETMAEAERALQELAEGLELDNVVPAEVNEEDEGGSLDDDMDGYVDEYVALSAVERVELDRNVYPVKKVLLKLRKLAHSIMTSSTILLPAWYTLLDDLVLPRKAIPRDVRTRWNSTYRMLLFCLDYREAVDQITSERRHGLRELELSEEEWQICQQLHDVLKIFYDATQFFSHQGHPNLSSVIPAMDRIDEALAGDAINLKFRPSVRVAAALGKKTLNKYYKSTDDSELYRIAMILHPAHKLEYFRDNNWSQGWMETAEGIVRDEFACKYAGRKRSAASDTSSDMSSAAKESKNLFDNLPRRSGKKKGPGPVKTELDIYLEADTEEVDDVIAWWWRHRDVYPNLSRMDLDYLSIPGTSVDIERAFSRGRIILPHLRNGLSANSIRAILCLGEWSLLNLVKDEDISAEVKVPGLEGEEDVELENGWDSIIIPQ